MRKIGFASFKDTTKEILPKTYKVNKITCQRRMFCTMINQYLSDRSKFNLTNDYIFENNLLSIFEDKIMSFFQFYKFKPEKHQKIIHIYKEDSLLINQYFKQSKNTKMQYLTKSLSSNQKFQMLFGYLHPANDLIQLIFNGKEIEMMLDLNEVFTRTVFNRIKKGKDKIITLDNNYIHINQDGILTRLYPRWKHVDTKNLKQRDSEINEAFEQLDNKEIDQCYLVYPKTNAFKRHITVKRESYSKELKMIPYSFTFINKGKKICQR